MEALSLNKINQNITPIIGLEVHIELGTLTKMFCSCPASHFQAIPNTQTCPVCLGLPGSLPVPQREAVERIILVGLSLNCQIPLFNKFDRKNYFYPDLPKGFQISQYDLPFARNGELECKVLASRRSGQSAKFKVGIRRVHLEEDTGKLIHRGGASLIDFNRSGVPLMEVVTEPDLNSAHETKLFLQQLQQLVRYLGVAEADMEKGQMRCEPNVNLEIQESGKSDYTPITEIKNINSFRFVEKAIDYEIKRQFEEFQKTRLKKAPGRKVTRGWDEKRQVTVVQRVKEEAEDYRYFPEPDIPPIRFTQSQISNLPGLAKRSGAGKSQIPELPQEKLARFMKEYRLSESQSQILIETRQKADYFEQAAKVGKDQGLDVKQVANWLINKPVNITQVSPLQVIQMILDQTRVSAISEEDLRGAVMGVIGENQRAVEDFKKGKTTALEFLVGQVARATKGKADPNLARKLLLEILQRSS